ncbi:MAG TPA: lysophospholipid acyltransferase family protein [Thermodesulfovibrionales bacterium]|nr:lysophospholipid acyltransferase family protein [Thermodesulfovibrionales bacterium]
MKKILWIFQAAGILIVFFPFSFLPVGLGGPLGVLLFHAWRSRRRIAIDNLMKSVELNALSLSESPEEIIKESFRNLGQSFIEIVKIYYGRGNRIVEEVVVRGKENVISANAKGKGVIFITGHCGNWELMAIASSFMGFPVAVVARALNNPYLNKLLEMARARFGNRIVYKRGALRDVILNLNDGGGIGILMDQAIVPREGYVIDFLGRGAWTTKVPSLIARKTGAPVLPVFIRRVGKSHEITIHPEVTLSSNSVHEDAVKNDTRVFSAFIEEYIRENPSQWLWLHRRWKRTGQVGRERPETAMAKETI